MNTVATSTALYLRLLSYVRPYAKTFGLAVLGMVATAATEPLFPALMKPLLDHGFGPGARPVPPLLFAAAIVGIFLLRGVLSFSSSYFLAWVGNRVVLDLRAAMFARLVRLPARFSTITAPERFCRRSRSTSAASPPPRPRCSPSSCRIRSR